MPWPGAFQSVRPEQLGGSGLLLWVYKTTILNLQNFWKIGISIRKPFWAHRLNSWKTTAQVWSSKAHRHLLHFKEYAVSHGLLWVSWFYEAFFRTEVEHSGQDKINSLMSLPENPTGVLSMCFLNMYNWVKWKLIPIGVRPCPRNPSGIILWNPSGRNISMPILISKPFDCGAVQE